MVKFIEVAPEDLPQFREGRRGRVSYPIVKGFLESDILVAKLDRTGMQQSLQSLYSSIGAYCRNHNVPVKIFQRGGDLYLMRLDMELVDGEKIKIEDWDKPQATNGSVQPIAITPEEVAKRFEEEKGQTTK